MHNGRSNSKQPYVITTELKKLHLSNRDILAFVEQLLPEDFQAADNCTEHLKMEVLFV